MYNRYIRNAHGEYICVPVPDPPRPQTPPPPIAPPSIPPPPPAPAYEQPRKHARGPAHVPPPHSAEHRPPPSHDHQPPPSPQPDASRFLARMLERMRLQDVDTGDLLLLLILFFLFEEKADDELLIALGLLLIL